jgi:acyl-CoA thioesterase FadM
MPWDCVFRLVGNDRYHAYLDLARADLAIRRGWLKPMLARKWQPQLISCHVRHRRPLHMFDRFVIYSYLAGASSKYIYMAHRFERNGVVVATAVSKLAAVSPAGIASLLQLPGLISRKHQKEFTHERLAVFGQVETILRNL